MSHQDRKTGGDDSSGPHTLVIPSDVTSYVDSRQVTIGCARVYSSIPQQYRLITRNGGGLALQGFYSWHEGLTRGCGEWRDIPKVEIGAVE